MNVLNNHFGHHENEADAENLAETLCDYPLALAQAVHTIGRDKSISWYLEQYTESQERRRELLSQPDFADHRYPYTVLNTWDIALQQVITRHPEYDGKIEEIFLEVLAFLDSDQIPLQIILD